MYQNYKLTYTRKLEVNFTKLDFEKLNPTELKRFDEKLTDTHMDSWNNLCDRILEKDAEH